MNKRNYGFAALALTAAFGLSACTLNINDSDSNGDKVVRKSYDDVFALPTCDENTNNGVEAYVTVDGKKDLYVCRDEWMKQLDKGEEEPIYPDDYRTPLSMGLLPNGLVILGTQVWDSKNVDVSEDADGFTIGHCYEDDEDNCKNFGRLYTWTEAMNLDKDYLHKKPSSSVVKKNHQGICPEGFHVPNGAEIDTLYKYVNKTRAAANYRIDKELSSGEDVQGVMLRTPNTAKDGTILWSDEEGTIQGIDAFGMSFVSSGVGRPDTVYNDDGEFDYVDYEYTELGKMANLWISNIDDDASAGLSFRFNYDNTYGHRDWWEKDKLLPVRCIMNKTAAEYKTTSEYKDMLEEALAEEESED